MPGHGTLAAVEPPALHPDVAHLAVLLGSWRGRGAGEYPTIAPFEYLEEVTFGHVGKPFLAYSQRTRAADDGRPLHAETGYWRPVGGAGLEVVLVHPTGVLEAAVGAIVGSVIELTAEPTLTPTAKSVTAVVRRFELDGDVLRYTLAMAAVGEPLTHHLAAELRRE